jgi:hypothetical protein
MLLGSSFHTNIFTACGKLPASPHLDLLRPLLASPAFSGCADDYLDARRSTLLMYCVGPANDESLPMVNRALPRPRPPPSQRALPARQVRLLAEHGADATWRNADGQSALAYAKAWQAPARAPRAPRAETPPPAAARASTRGGAGAAVGSHPPRARSRGTARPGVAGPAPPRPRA